VNSRFLAISGGIPRLQIVLCILIILFISNLNAIIDLVLHPEIPYFDLEHMIVGGVTGLVSLLLFGLLFRHMHRLEIALNTIRSMEKILPICSCCRRIRKPGADPKQVDSWVPIEAYITQKTTTTFSHGICPDCVSKIYPEYDDRKAEDGRNA
jgi:hypothetical protein